MFVFLRRKDNIRSTSIKEQVNKSIFRASIEYTCYVLQQSAAIPWIICKWNYVYTHIEKKYEPVIVFGTNELALRRRSTWSYIS